MSWEFLNKKDLHKKLISFPNDRLKRRRLVINLKEKLTLEDVHIVIWLKNYIPLFSIKNIWESNGDLINIYVVDYLRNKVILYALKNQTKDYSKLKNLIDYRYECNYGCNYDEICICNCFLKNKENYEEYFNIFKNNDYFWLNTNLCKFCLASFTIEELYLYSKNIVWSSIDYSIFSQNTLIEIQNYIDFRALCQTVHSIEILNYYIKTDRGFHKNLLELNLPKIKQENSKQDFDLFIEKIYNIVKNNIEDKHSFTFNLLNYLSCSFLIKEEAYLLFPNSILLVARENGCCEKLIKLCFYSTNYRNFFYNWKHIQKELIDYIDTIGAKNCTFLFAYIKLTPEIMNKYKCVPFWNYINKNVFLDLNFLERYITYLNFEALKNNNFIKEEFNKYCTKYNYK